MNGVHNSRHNLLIITYRCTNKDDTFSNYLSQSIVIKLAKNGAMMQGLIKLSDISFMG